MAEPRQIDLEEAIAAAIAARAAVRDLPRGHYGVICADPPWKYTTWSAKGEGRSASQHYDVMRIEDIKALPVGDLGAKDSVLLLWAINPMLPQALEVMDAWGYTFKTIGFCWTKTTKRSGAGLPKYHFGMGHWARANVEICLLGSRGKPKRREKGVPQLIVSNVREHSHKPDEFYPRVERLCFGPYLDLFSRESRPGWNAFGNEVGKFNRPELGDGLRAGHNEGAPT